MSKALEYLREYVPSTNIPEEWYEFEIAEMMRDYAQQYHEELVKKDLIAGVVGSLPSRQDYLKTMLDWHDEYLKDGNFNIPLDHEQSEYLSWLANRLAKVYGQ